MCLVALIIGLTWFDLFVALVVSYTALSMQLTHEYHHIRIYSTCRNLVPQFVNCQRMLLDDCLFGLNLIVTVKIRYNVLLGLTQS
jgi:hypothetical protein